MVAKARLNGWLYLERRRPSPRTILAGAEESFRKVRQQSRRGNIVEFYLRLRRHLVWSARSPASGVVHLFEKREGRDLFDAGFELAGLYSAYIESL